MAGELLFADSFEQYANVADLALAYDSVAGNMVLTTARARSGSKSLTVLNPIRKIFAETHTNLILGFCPFLPAPLASSAKGLFFRNASANLVACVIINPDNSITVQDRLGVERGTSRPLLTPGVFHHVECNIQFAPDEVGALKVRIDGNTSNDIDATGIDMGDDPIAMVEFGQFTGLAAGAVGLDDWYCFDGDDWKGQVVMFTNGPNSDGADTDWALTGAATTFEAIDEMSQDGDTTCITASTIGDVSSVGFPDAPANISAIKGVLLYAMAKTTDPGDATLRLDCNSGGTVEEGVSNPLFSNYKYFMQGFHLDPDTGFAWEATEYNAMLAEYVKDG